MIDPWPVRRSVRRVAHRRIIFALTTVVAAWTSGCAGVATSRNDNDLHVSAPVPKVRPEAGSTKENSATKNPMLGPTVVPPQPNAADRMSNLSASASSADEGAVRQVGFTFGDASGRDGEGRCVASGHCGDLLSEADCQPGVAMQFAAPIAMPLPPQVHSIDPNEFLCNGYDRPPRAAPRAEKNLIGIETGDVVARYRTTTAGVDLATSNRVCVYAPRFGSVRKITEAVAGEKAVGVSLARMRRRTAGIDLDEGGVTVTRNMELAHAEVARRADAFRERNRGVPIERTQQVVQQTDVLAALVGLTSEGVSLLNDEERTQLRRHNLSAIDWSIGEGVEAAIADVVAPAITRLQAAEEFRVYEFPDAGRLEILKLVDRLEASPGDVLTFTLTIRNVGDSEVSEVRITDSLQTRLAYEEGSETTSIESDFVAAANDAGSSRLTWTFNEPLAVGDTITVTFAAKVR